MTWECKRWENDNHKIMKKSLHRRVKRITNGSVFVSSVSPRKKLEKESLIEACDQRESETVGVAYAGHKMGNAQSWTVHHSVGRLARYRDVGSLQVKDPLKWLCWILPSKLPVVIADQD